MPNNDDQLPSHPNRPYSAFTTRLPEHQIKESLGEGQVETENIADGAITDVELADGSVTTVKLGNAAVTTEKIGDGQLTTAKIGDAQVTTGKMGDNQVTTAKIGDQQVTTAKIGNEQITQVKMSAGLFVPVIVSALPGLPSSAYPQGATVVLTTDNKLYRSTGSAWTAVVPTTDLSGQVTSAQITDLAVTTAKLNDLSVSTAKIAESAVETGKLAAQAVDSTKLADLAVTNGKLAALSVDSAKLADLAVTTAKLVNDAITNAKIADFSIDGRQLMAQGFHNLADNAGYELGDVGWPAKEASGGSTNTIVNDPANARTGVWCARVVSNGVAGGTGQRNNLRFSVSPGEQFYVSGWFKTTGTITGFARISWMDAAYAEFATSGAPSVGGAGYTQSAAIFVAPANAVYGRLEWFRSSPGANGDTMFVDDLFCTKAVTSDLIVANAIIAGKIAAGAVGTNELSAGAVTAAKITAGTITAVEIAAATITGAKIAAATITSGNIQALTITAAEIAAATIIGSKIAAGTITAENIAALTITAAEIAAGTITGGKIAAGTIQASNIQALTITAAEIAAATITGAKIAAGTITAANIAAGTITANEIAADTIVAGNIAAGAIGATELAAGSVVAGKIAADAVTASEIAAGAVTASKLAATMILTNLLQVDDTQGSPVTRVRLGKLGEGSIEYGLEIRDETGGLVFGANGLGAQTLGALGQNTVNVILNSDFEQGSMFWSRMKSQTTQVHSGAKSGQIDSVASSIVTANMVERPTDSGASFSPTGNSVLIPITPGTEIEMAAVMRCGQSSGNRIRLGFQEFNDSRVYLRDRQIGEVIGNLWLWRVGSLTASSDAYYVSPYLKNWNDPGFNNAAYVDTVRMRVIVKPRCKVQRTAVQTITTGVETAVSWDSEVYDFTNWHDNSTNPSRLVVPVTAAPAFIRLAASVQWAPGTTGYRRIRIRKNGSSIIAEDTRGGTITIETAQSCRATDDKPIPGDYYEVLVTHTQGANLNINSTTSATNFTAEALY